MLNLKVVTSAQHQLEADSAGGTGEDDTLPHGAVVLKRLAAQWAGSKRNICADSYFASVAGAMLLLSMGLRFVGVIKTATRGYPMAALSVIPVAARGGHASFTHVNAEGKTDMMAVMWDDLKLEHKFVTQDWSMRINLSLLGICIVDSWMLYGGAQGVAADLSQAQFYEDLAEQLIDNTYDSV
eukprot:contig_12388_g2959